MVFRANGQKARRLATSRENPQTDEEREASEVGPQSVGIAFSLPRTYRDQTERGAMKGILQAVVAVLLVSPALSAQAPDARLDHFAPNEAVSASFAWEQGAQCTLSDRIGVGPRARVTFRRDMSTLPPNRRRFARAIVRRSAFDVQFKAAATIDPLSLQSRRPVLCRTEGYSRWCHLLESFGNSRELSHRQTSSSS